MSGLGVFFSEYLDYENSEYTESIVGLSSKAPNERQTNETDHDRLFRTKMQVFTFLTSRLGGTEEEDNDVPHVDSTRGSVHNLSDLDLHVRTVSLDLCRIVKCWPFRETRRRTINCEDGKLSVIYGNVYSIEIQQCYTQDSTLRNLARNLHPHQQTSIMVHLYGKYAMQMKALDERYCKSNHTVYMALSNIPAQCIMPNKVNWFQTNEYCLCIGSQSTFKIRRDHHPEVSVRFDDDRLQLTLLVLEKNGGQSVYTIKNNTDSGKVITTEVREVAPILDLYKEFTTSSKRPRIGTDYTLLKDLKLTLEMHTLLSGSKHIIVNLCAVVMSFTQPHRSKRGDWFMSVNLVDDSLALCENATSEDSFVHSIVINIFVGHEQKEKLPKLLYAGDVMLLHNVELSTWKDEEQLTGRKDSHYIVYRVDYLEPQQEYFRNPKVTPRDAALAPEQRTRMEDLWRWAQRRFLLHASMKLAHCFKISDMKLQNVPITDAQGDLAVMVAAIIPTPEQFRSPSTPAGFLRVWDGTGPPLSDNLPLDCQAAYEAIRSGDPPQACLIRIAQIIEKLRTIHDNPNLTPPKALTGRVANVAIWESQHWELIRENVIKVGSFIRLRNVKDQKMFKDDFRCLHVHEKSSLTPIQDYVYEVVHLLEQHNSRILRKEPTNPASGVLPRELPSQQDETQGDRAPDRRRVEEFKEDAPTTPPRHRNLQIRSPTRSPQSRRPGRCDNLDEFVAAPVATVFEGQVRITGVLPSFSSLSADGLDAICLIARPSGMRYYQFGLSLIQDEASTTIDAVVCDDHGRNGTTGQLGKALFGMPAGKALEDSTGALVNITKVLDAKLLWHAEMHSVEYDGYKYFVVTSLSTSAVV